MKKVGVLVVAASLAGCGGSTSEGPHASTTMGASTEPTSPSEEPSTPPAEEVAEAPRETAPAPVAPVSSRAVLIDGVRDAVLLDELAGFRLVGGAGTLALVGPDGHVRASHRFAFGSTGASGVLLAPHGEATHAVVGNGDRDGFRGPWSGRFGRWDLDRDTLEGFGAIEYDLPQFARLGPLVIAVDTTNGTVFTVTDTAFVEREEIADRVVWAPDRPPECIVGTESESFLARLDERGALSLAARTEGAPMPGQPPPTPMAWPMDRALGARGLPSLRLAPVGARLIVATSSSMIVLGPEGPGPETPLRWEASWDGPDATYVDGVVRPLAVPTHAGRSLLVDAIPYPGEAEGDSTVPETRAYLQWVYGAGESEEGERRGPPPRIAPVCSRGRGARCVRAHFEEGRITGWDIYDRARPTRVLRQFPVEEYPPGVGHTLIAPGGRFMRTYDGSYITLTPLPGGPELGEIDVAKLAELPSGWVFVEPADPSSLRGLSYDGTETRRALGSEVRSLSIVDETHVLAVHADSFEVIEVPSLATTRTIARAAPGRVLHCDGTSLVDEAGEEAEGDCPVGALTDYEVVSMSGDRAFWVDGRLGDEAHVHRSSDGAELVVRVSTAGLLVSGPGGVFEGNGAVLDHVVVREPGPVRTATITTGREARARFERPGLVAAFFGGRALPAP
ncbi:MAG: hypothetical protein K1X94_13275 [Sandaracinaceae bacterium]|nr:hypothetical protein [Sandaracinaceae bacterium]